jgi:hypothetical protein
MTDRPIIFSAPMIRALLEGRKTQTRRFLKPQPIPALCWDVPEGKYPSPGGWSRIPYTPGDRLWVREGWANDEGVGVQYRAGPHIADDAVGVRWRSPIHMPRKASRLTLTVKWVQIQRLQDISETDAIAEGVDAVTIDGVPRQAAMLRRADFAAIWNIIYGPATWDANPWVCAVTFDVHRGNIDSIKGQSDD